MLIELRDTPFEPLVELASYQSSLDRSRCGQYGATAMFIGTMRDANDGEAVRGLTLEHYPGMTERYLQRSVESAFQQWPLLDALVIHRVGALHRMIRWCWWRSGRRTGRRRLPLAGSSWKNSSRKRPSGNARTPSPGRTGSNTTRRVEGTGTV